MFSIGPVGCKPDRIDSIAASTSAGQVHNLPKSENGFINYQTPELGTHGRIYIPTVKSAKPARQY